MVVFEPLPWEGRAKKSDQEQELIREKRKQPGVTFPSAAKQEHVFIIRLDLRSDIQDGRDVVRDGLRDLCNFFYEIDNGIVKIDELEEDGTVFCYPLSKYNFSATIGFGNGFFEKLEIEPAKRPRRIFSMPKHHHLGDSIPYTLRQTDLILQLASNKDFVNRWIFENDSYDRIPDEAYTHKKQSALQGTNEDPMNIGWNDQHVRDIESIVEKWALVTDTQSGFQRMDGRNLMGFNDGISNPDRLNNEIVWIPESDKTENYPDGTYMVFQKIEHDLERWKKFGIQQQENWVGRSKATGLLLGSLTRDEDQMLARDCQSSDSNIQNAARKRLKDLLKKQMDPETEFFSDTQYERIRLECPIWSHVRRSNPRGSCGSAKKIIYRRGYLFMTDGQDGQTSSGLLFICFQRDVEQGFEYIKRNFLSGKNLGVSESRQNFKSNELAERVKQSAREVQTGPSPSGVNVVNESSLIRVLGGGYYFVPPIPNKNVRNIAEQFF